MFFGLFSSTTGFRPSYFSMSLLSFSSFLVYFSLLLTRLFPWSPTTLQRQPFNIWNISPKSTKFNILTLKSRKFKISIKVTRWSWRRNLNKSTENSLFWTFSSINLWGWWPYLSYSYTSPSAFNSLDPPWSLTSFNSASTSTGLSLESPNFLLIFLAISWLIESRGKSSGISASQPPQFLLSSLFLSGSRDKQK